VVDAVKAALLYESIDTQTRPLIDKDRVAVVGGSHGGFLAAHLSARHKDIFKVAALRNPVINIPAMYTTSDIPDWCVVESIGTDAFNFDTCDFASPEALQRMRDASPCVHASQVSAPTLLCLGMKDRRVPYSQGMEYYNYLKSRGVMVDLRLYPEDCHAIDKPTSEADQFISIRNWLAKYM
jgi:acylaminoacyl-peptidase